MRDGAVGDSGEYECQVTTPNATVIIINLNILGGYKVFIASTACGHRMANRKWKETKQLPGTAGPGNMLSS